MAKVEGIDRLKRRLQRMPAAVFDEVAAAVEKGAIEITDMQKRLVPVKSGDLQDSIQYSMDGKTPKYAAFQKGGKGSASSVAQQLGVSATISAGNSKVRYAHLVEFGTAPHAQPKNWRVGFEHPGARPHPFFFPAYRSLKRRVKGRITRAVNKGVKKSAGK